MTVVFVVRAGSHEEAARRGESLIDAALSVDFSREIDTAWVEHAVPAPIKETA